MLSISCDEEALLAVYRFTGPENSDADYAAYCASILELNELKGPSDLLRIVILLVDSDNPIPNASWRKKIAEASANIKPNTLSVLVSERAIVRGILTALNWIRPPTFQTSIARSFEEALDIVAGFRPEAIPGLHKLSVDCDRLSQGKPSR